MKGELENEIFTGQVFLFSLFTDLLRNQSRAVHCSSVIKERPGEWGGVGWWEGGSGRGGEGSLRAASSPLPLEELLTLPFFSDTRKC